MAECIEREAVKQIIAAQCGECADVCLEFDGIMPDCNQCLLYGAKKAIDSIPAADEQPVVLCKDCKYWNRERISCEGLARCNTGESGIRYRSQYDFCSRGEKREES